MFIRKLYFLLLFFIGFNASSQNCFSTGTGSDGAYIATVNTTLLGGTYNFTSFTINPGVTVSIIGNNPLIIYCNGSVTIDGTLSANGGNGENGITYSNGGAGGIGVAGGANGGSGSFSSSSGPLNGTEGSFTGGTNTQGMQWSGGGGAGYAVNGMPSGNASGGSAGIAYGIADLTTFLAGSGGGGGSGGYDCGAGGGGAGGGFIFINANSITISTTGILCSNGGNGGSDGTGNCGGGGGGSGGAIWIGAPVIENNGMITTLGGVGGASNVPGTPYFGVGGNGAIGRIRIDVAGALSGSGNINPIVGYENNISPLFTSQSIDLCFGESIAVGSNVYSSPGTFLDVVPSIATGCDSTITTTITVQNELLSSQTITICNGNSLSVGSSVYTTSGTYTDVLSSVVSGCDSTVTTNLTVQNELLSSQTITICYGNSLSVGSSVYATSGTYTDVLSSVLSGCDSTVTTNLTVQNELMSSQTITICNGNSITVGSSVYTTSGTYTDVLSSVLSGCDSIVSTNLTVDSPIDVTINEIEGDLIVVESGAAYQWIDCDNGNSEIFGEINQSLTPINNGNYAVEVTLNGCSVTSSCFLVDFIGISEINNNLNNPKKLVKITDLLGRETVYQPNTVLIFIYSDGTIIRSMSFE